MQLVVRVVCGERGSTFRVPVGDGQQSFKWLALVAAQRFGSESPKGKVRQRERKFPATNVANTNLVPMLCYTETCDFFHPDALLSDKLEDGAELTVEVAPRVLVRADGSPLKSRWQTIAFAVSPSSASRREQAIAEEDDAQHAKQVSLIAVEAEVLRVENKRKATHVRQLIQAQLPDADAAADSLSEDWFAMNKNGVLDVFIGDPEEQARIQTVFAVHYVQLDELFKAFAASGASLADARDLDAKEFEDFCKQANLMAVGPHGMSAVASCFAEAGGDFSHGHRSSQKKKRGAGPTKDMERPEFLNALLWFALYWASTDGKDVGGHGAPGGPAWAEAFAAVAGNASTKLETLLELRVVPLIHRKLPGALGKVALNTDAVLAKVYDVETDLRRVFASWCRTVDHELTVIEFVGIVDAAGLVGRAADSKVALTLKDARQTFAATQAEAGGQGQVLMSFGEFIEGAVRLGLTKWPSDDLALAERTDRALRALATCPV